MLRYIRKIIRSQQGFTLIELMVVVVILGILATIAVPRYMDKKAEAVAARVAADKKVLQNAVDLYYFDNDGYPVDFNALVEEGYLQDEPTSPEEDKEYTIGDDGEIIYDAIDEGVEE